jgi:hypothetical protein
MLRRSLLGSVEQHRDPTRRSLHSLAEIFWPLGLVVFFASDLVGLTSGGWAAVRATALLISTLAGSYLVVRWARRR